MRLPIRPIDSQITGLQAAGVLIEHHMSLVMRVSDQVVALDFGRKIDGTPTEVQRNPDVIRAYLGGKP